MTESKLHKISSKTDIGLNNRDGSLFAVETVDGKYFLVLEAETYHEPETFDGMGSTVSQEISKEAFTELAKSIGKITLNSDT